MRVFVTGATGFVGSAVVRDLLGAGHRVLGLARSDKAAEVLAMAGAEILRGDLNDHASLRVGARSSDAVVHTAFIHDFSRFAENCEVDRKAVLAMGEALSGTSKPLVVTSGTALVKPGAMVDEDMSPSVGPHMIPRIASELAAQKLAENGLNVHILRLPPSVHGVGDHGFVPFLIDLARQKRVSAYIGEGSNHWSAVHREDAARLYRLIIEKNPEQFVFHAVAEPAIPFRNIAEKIADRLALPTVELPDDEIAGHFGWFAHFASIDAMASSEKTRMALGWWTDGPGLLQDLDGEAYFASR